jgi:hypothetical protein
MLSSASSHILGVSCTLCKSIQASSMDKYCSISQSLVSLAKTLPYTCCHDVCYNYYCSKWSTSPCYVHGVLKSVSIGTSHSCMIHALVLGVSSPRLSWVRGGIHLTIICMSDIEVDGSDTWKCVDPITQLGSSTLSSSERIPSLPVALSQGSVGSVSVPLTQPTAFYLAVAAMRRISPLHHHFVGIHRVSWESRGTAPCWDQGSPTKFRTLHQVDQ